jgi:hypothetical protein
MAPIGSSRSACIALGQPCSYSSCTRCASMALADGWYALVSLLTAELGCCALPSCGCELGAYELGAYGPPVHCCGGRPPMFGWPKTGNGEKIGAGEKTGSGELWNWVLLCPLFAELGPTAQGSIMSKASASGQSCDSAFSIESGGSMLRDPVLSSGPTRSSNCRCVSVSLSPSSYVTRYPHFCCCLSVVIVASGPTTPSNVPWPGNSFWTFLPGKQWGMRHMAKFKRL